MALPKGNIPWNKGKTGLQVAWNKGKKYSEKVRRKISIAHKGLSWGKHTKKWKEDMSEARKGFRHTDKTRAKMSADRRGKMPKFIPKPRYGVEHHNWKGGISAREDRIRHSTESASWKKATLTRDNYICQKTGSSDEVLTVHHIRNFAQYPELRFCVDNGIALSSKSHKEFHRIYGKKDNTPEQLDEFLNAR